MLHRWFVAALALLVVGIVPAYGKDKPEWRSWPMGDRAGLVIGGFFANLDTTVRVDGTMGAIGTQISFERDLGLDDTKTRPMVNAYWRFLKRHRLDFLYFNLDRSGDSISAINIRFGDKTFQANLPIQAFLDIETYNFGYSYSILFDEKKDWTIGLALSFQDMAIGLQGTGAVSAAIVSESDSVLAPLPTFTTQFRYAFTPKWILVAGAGYFTIEIDLGDGQFDGNIYSGHVGMKWKPLKYLNLGLSYQYFDVDVDVEETRLHWAIDYQYDGPMLTIGTQF
jgi:hypothetical protein